MSNYLIEKSIFVGSYRRNCGYHSTLNHSIYILDSMLSASLCSGTFFSLLAGLEEKSSALLCIDLTVHVALPKLLIN